MVLRDELLKNIFVSHRELDTDGVMMAELTLNRYCRSMSDSSFVTPLIRRVNPRFT